MKRISVKLESGVVIWNSFNNDEAHEILTRNGHEVHVPKPISGVVNCGGVNVRYNATSVQNDYDVEIPISLI